MKQPRVLKPGMSGSDVYAVKRALRKWARSRHMDTPIASPVHNGKFDLALTKTLADFQEYHGPIKREKDTVGPLTWDALEPWFDAWGRFVVRAYAKKHAPLSTSPPLAVMGQIIGWPYVGTHADFGNWESDNAQDISARTGTPVLAVREGVIGSQIGPLDTGGDPALLGLRLHLVTTTNEFYYAHLSHLDVVAGQHVQAGQRLGLSGSANDVEHLHLGVHHGDPGLYTGTSSQNYHDHNYPG